ncbi:anti-sigma regulatory factor (Ser/Thr protein kinase) [Streptomyces sp. SAI-117]|uniref:ATP-binding protein n=1 Tax=unclassified Streptomyces TaxID=2593676 RepID=UPI00247610B7|nr:MULTISPECIES: ATP-binding protein [unclassified Streptomyces]MDH6553861.1 anti-sigma regulatory factor (Ser/Thr protein kinase) [Streptomyces sp. SAI-041]MDH6572939.1 anti-sigma regulatory factor (Ser/Thr protein kinase) [Streptomyces sp. SAI-117]MDH6582099.1 anti-sigma regulatory factor (Ser/Thr protein kinase) [Streptomyces sp. SAI-133]
MSTRLDALPYRHVLTLPTEPAAVRLARQTAERALIEWGVSLRHPAVDPALLILSELVTNSVRHAAALSPTVTVIYAAGPDCLAFAVHDRHPYQPSLHEPCTETGAGGLATVMELTLGLGGSARVRGDADAGGKSIWITLPLRPLSGSPWVPGQGSALS